MGAETLLLRPSHHARIYEVERGERWVSIGRKETVIPSLTKPSNISSPSEVEPCIGLDRMVPFQPFKDVEGRISMKFVAKPAKFKLKSRIQG
jgi:hypothetical protein